MKHYIDPTTKEVYAYESDGSQDAYIKAGLEPLSDADLAEIRQIPLPSSQPIRYTSLEFLDFFTQSEQLSVVQATLTQAVVKLWYDRMLAAGYITIADERTSAGLDALVGAGLLTAERRTQIIEVMS